MGAGGAHEVRRPVSPRGGWKRTMAKVSVANRTLTKPLANRISTICGREHMVSTTLDYQGVGA